MGFKMRSCIILLIIFFVAEVRVEETVEILQLSESEKDIPLKTYTQQENVSSTTVIPSQSMYPYPYNFYFQNPFQMYPQHMYNYQRSPYFQPPQYPTASPLQSYSFNPAGYSLKVTQKYVNGEEVPQNIDFQIPPQVAVPSNKLPKWPSGAAVVSQTPAAENAPNTVPYNTEGSAEIIAQPMNSMKESGSGMITDSSERTNGLKSSADYDNTGETHLELRPALPDVLPNEVDNGASVDLQQNDAESKTLRFIDEAGHDSSTERKNKKLLDIGTAFQGTGGEGVPMDLSKRTTPSFTENHSEEQIKHSLETRDDIPKMETETGQRSNSMDLIQETEPSTIMKYDMEQSKHTFGTTDNIPNTILVQISTVHQDRSIEVPQVGPSGNTILFPLSGLVQKVKNVGNIPSQTQRETSCSPCIHGKNSNVLEDHEEDTLATTENNQPSRGNKNVDVSILNSVELQESNTVQSSPTKTKGVPIPENRGNIVIRLPSGQELVIDLSRAKEFSGADSRKIALRDESTQPINILTNQTLSEQNELKTDENNLQATMVEKNKNYFSIPHDSLEQNEPILSLSNTNGINQNVVPIQVAHRTGKYVESAETKDESLSALFDRMGATSNHDPLLSESVSEKVVQNTYWPSAPAKDKYLSSAISQNERKIKLNQGPIQVRYSFG